MSATDGEITEDAILISDISVRSKTSPHNGVLTGSTGRLLEDEAGRHLFVFRAGSRESNGGPQLGSLYKITFEVAGVLESILQITYIGYAGEFQRYIFTKKT